MATDFSKPSEGLSSVLELAELGALFETHCPRLLAIVRRRIDPALGQRLDAEDVVNAAFLDARRRWPSYRAEPKTSPFVWLYRIVIGRFIEECRRARTGGVRVNVAWPERPSIDLGLRLVARDTSPTRAVAREEEAELMKKALELLREPDREVIMLRSYEELSFAEIGEVLGIEENTATVRYVRALRRLKDAWQRLTGESRP